MQVRLTRKLANYLDGIDLSDYREGDVLDLPRRDASLLIAEHWATPARGVADAVGDSASRCERRRSARISPACW